MTAMGELQRAVERHRRELLRHERAAATRMVRAYGVAWRRVSNALYAVTERIERARMRGEEPSIGSLFQQERFAALQAQVAREIESLARYADREVAQEQLAAVRMAQVHAREQVRAAGAHVRVSWTRLPADALRDLVGALGDGTPLADRLLQLGAEAVQGVRDALVAGVALGRGPREIAHQVRTAIGGNMSRALTISRTETMRAYRESTQRAYEANSRVLVGWHWWATLDERTCLFCIAQHGSMHAATERMYSHPNCRCVMLPVTQAQQQLGQEEWTGPEWFMMQPYDVKVRIAGRGMYEALRGRDGPALWERLSQTRGWSRYGPQPVRIALRHLEGTGLGYDVRRGLEWLRAHEREPEWLACRDMLDRMVPVVTRTLGLECRWNKEVEIMQLDSAWGLARWGNHSIAIDPDAVAHREATDAVLCHELLHHCSVKAPEDYAVGPGWEEGVVDAALTGIWPTLRRWLGVVPEEPYIGYPYLLEPLADIAQTLGTDVGTLGLRLIRVRLQDRPAAVRQWIADLNLRASARLPYERAAARLRRWERGKTWLF